MGYKNKALYISVLKKNNLSCKMHFTTSHRSEFKAAAAEQDGTEGFFFWVSISGRHLKTKAAEARACIVFGQRYSLCAEAYLGLEQGVCKLNTGEKKWLSQRWPTWLSNGWFQPQQHHLNQLLDFSSWTAHLPAIALRYVWGRNTCQLQRFLSVNIHLWMERDGSSCKDPMQPPSFILNTHISKYPWGHATLRGGNSKTNAAGVTLYSFSWIN